MCTVLSLVSVLTACASTSDAPMSAVSEPITTVSGVPSPPAPTVQESVDAGCSAKYPRREVLKTDQASEARYLDEIVLCSGSSSEGSIFSIANNSPAVWAFFSRTGASIQRNDGDQAADLFRETVAAGHLYEHAYMAPSEVMEVPAALVIDPSFEWRVNLYLTRAWLGQDVMKSSFENLSEASWVYALARGSVSRKAVVQCSISYGKLVTSDDLSVETPEHSLLTGFHLLSTAGTCAKAWRLAERAEPNVAPKFAIAVERAGTTSEAALKIHAGWSWVRTLCASIRYC